MTTRERAIPKARQGRQDVETEPARAAVRLADSLKQLPMSQAPLERALVQVRLAGALIATAEFAGAAEACRDAQVVLSPEEFPDLHALTAERHAIALRSSDNAAGAQRVLEAALAKVPPQAGPSVRARLLAARARVMDQGADGADGNVAATAAEAQMEALQAARAGTDRALLVRMLNESARALAALPAERAQPERALELWDEAAGIVDAVDRNLAVAVHANRGTAYATRRTGDADANLAEAIASYDRALALVDSGSPSRHRSELLRSVGEVWARRATTRGTEGLIKAVGSWQAALTALPPDTAGSERATLYNAIGLTYVDRDQRGEEGQFDAAIEAFEAGLRALSPLSGRLEHARDLFKAGVKVYSATALPGVGENTELAAQLLNNLGSAQMSAAASGRSVSLGAAVEALDQAAELWRALGAAGEEAGSLLNAGLCHLSLHGRDPAGGHLDAAIDRLRLALPASTDERSRPRRAIASFNLGLALAMRAAHEDQTDLHDAADAFRSALSVWTLETAPAQAALTHSNLAGILLGLEGDRAVHASEAIEQCDLALKIFRPETHAAQHAVVMRNRNLAERRVAREGSGG